MNATGFSTALFEAGYFAFASGVTAFKDLFRAPHRTPPPLPIPVVDGAFLDYANEISRVAGSPFLIRQVREGGPFWRDALRALLDIKDLGRALGARIVLVYLPSRGEIYYERATGRPLPAETFERIEASALEQFCAKNGIEFLNPSEAIRRYLAAMPSGASPSDYPYLKLDGHMSARGHALVAEVVLAALAPGASAAKP